MALSKGMMKFYEFLKTRTVGAVVTEAEICTAADWKPTSFKTYIGKHKLDSLLARVSPGNFRILKAGPSLAESDVEPSMTQVAHEHAIPPIYAGQVVHGLQDSYKLIAKLGNGAVAHVWSASSIKSPGEGVACKVVNPRPDLIEPSMFANVAKRFAREAGNGQKMSHDAVVRYLDSGMDEQQRPFLVMELAERSVADALKPAVKFDALAAKEAILRVCEALAYLHGQRVIHRDVKPANMLKTKRGVVLADFGIVRWSEFNPAFTSANTITRASIQLGSWYYMAPEQQVSPHEAVPGSDIYALGISWYELLTGAPPAPTAVAARRAPPPSVDPVVNDLIVRMTAYDAKDRPSSAEVLAALS